MDLVSAFYRIWEGKHQMMECKKVREMCEVESPIKNLFTHMVAQTYEDLGRDKGEIRLFWKLW